MKTIDSLKYFVTHCLWKRFLDCSLPEAPSSLIILTILVTVRPWPFTSSEPNVQANKMQ